MAIGSIHSIYVFKRPKQKKREKKNQNKDCNSARDKVKNPWSRAGAVIVSFST